MTLPKVIRKIKLAIGDLSEDMRDVTIIVAFVASIIFVYAAAFRR